MPPNPFQQFQQQVQRQQQQNLRNMQGYAWLQQQKAKEDDARKRLGKKQNSTPAKTLFQYKPNPAIKAQPPPRLANALVPAGKPVSQEGSAGLPEKPSVMVTSPPRPSRVFRLGVKLGRWFSKRFAN